MTEQSEGASYALEPYWWYHKLSLATGARDRMVPSVVINFSSKVYSKRLLKGGHLCRVPHFRKLYLVQKYGGRYFAKVKRIYILSRSMEADMFNKRISAYGYIL